MTKKLKQGDKVILSDHPDVDWATFEGFRGTVKMDPMEGSELVCIEPSNPRPDGHMYDWFFWTIDLVRLDES